MGGWRARGWAKELKGVQGFRCACALSLSRPIAGHPPVHTSPFYTKWQGDLLPSGQSVVLKELKTLKPEGLGFNPQGGVLLLVVLVLLLLRWCCCCWCCCCCAGAAAAGAAAGAAAALVLLVLLLLVLCCCCW